jgi:hypothetical protein
MLMIAASVAAMFQCGCAADAFLTVRQPVQLQVVDVAQAKPVRHAYVEFAGAPPLGADERQWLAEQGQFTFRTDADGRATVPVEWSWIVPVPLGGLFMPLYPDSDTHRDRVTGRDYLCRVEDARGAEILPVNLKAGAVANGRLFSLRVESIGKPVEARDMIERGLHAEIEAAHSVRAKVGEASVDVSKTQIRELVKRPISPWRLIRPEKRGRVAGTLLFTDSFGSTTVHLLEEPPSVEVISLGRDRPRRDRYYLVEEDELIAILNASRAHASQGQSGPAASP